MNIITKINTLLEEEDKAAKATLLALLEFVIDELKQPLQKEILAITTKEELLALSEEYTREYLSTVCDGRGNSRPNSATSSSKSKQTRPPDFSTNTKSRDKNTCLLTGVKNSKVISLTAAHIIPFKNVQSDTLGRFLDRKSNSQIEDLKHFLDTPQNGLTLKADVHDSFGKFGWYLENILGGEMIKYDSYAIRESSVGFFEEALIFNRNKEEVKDGDKLLFPADVDENDLPHPFFIRLHASVAKVLHASGRGEELTGHDDPREPDQLAQKESFDRINFLSAREERALERGDTFVN